MSGNIIVSTTTNRVVWDVDQTSYGKALKAVKSSKLLTRSLLKRWSKHRSGLLRVKAKQH
jgi:hypothetical protein